MLSTQIAITVIYTCNMFVLFCACDVMNVLSVKKKRKFTKKIKKKKKKKKDNTMTKRKGTKKQQKPEIKEATFRYELSVMTRC